MAGRTRRAPQIDNPPRAHVSGIVDNALPLTCPHATAPLAMTLPTVAERLRRLPPAAIAVIIWRRAVTANTPRAAARATMQPNLHRGRSWPQVVFFRGFPGRRVVNLPTRQPPFRSQQRPGRGNGTLPRSAPTKSLRRPQYRWAAVFLASCTTKHSPRPRAVCCRVATGPVGTYLRRGSSRLLGDACGVGRPTHLSFSCTVRAW